MESILYGQAEKPRRKEPQVLTARQLPPLTHTGKLVSRTGSFRYLDSAGIMLTREGFVDRWRKVDWLRFLTLRPLPA